MKILVFLTKIDVTKGGPSRSVPIFVRGLALEGVDVTLMAFKTENMNLHALDGTNAKIHIIDKNYSIKELEEFVRKERFDLIQGQCIWEPLFHHMSKIAYKLNIPCILTPRGTLEPWSLQQNKWKKKIARWLYQDRDLKRCACIYTTAEMEAQHIRELGFYNPICIIPNGIETDGYPCRSNPSLVKKQILFLSRVHPKKGIEVLIDAYAALYESFPDWNVVIVGNGEAEYRLALNNKIEMLGLSGNVKILDPVFGSAKTKLYQESSIFCLPSYSENFGMVIAEAMSCGVPVITTNGTPWQLLNGTRSTMGVTHDILDEAKRTGWCIDLSVDNLRETLLQAMTMDPSILFEMGQKASMLINRSFNYHTVAKKNKELYEWIINGGVKPSSVLLMESTL